MTKPEHSTNSISKTEYFEAYQKYWNSIDVWDGFYEMFRQCKLIDAEPGKLTFEFVVTQDVLNGHGILHGGATATLLDVLMSMTIRDPFEQTNIHKQTGVTVDLTIYYLNAAKIGDVIIIQVEKLKSGKTMGFFKSKITRKNDGVLIAVAQQTLAILLKEKSKL
uniref:Thioesterase domain-containing protein n=2 Tax=Panagrolaimus sp. JU765 TaxID=591449 RepID=A0AC34QVX6_9BILA